MVISARTEEQLDEVAAESRGAPVARGGRAGRPQRHGQPRRLVDAARERSAAALDIVVNNVGGTMPMPLLETEDKFLEEAFHFNVTTALALTRAAVPVMLETRRRQRS